MDRTELQTVQKPLKERYREEPAAALITLRADGELDEEQIACKVDTGRMLVEAGLHPATGGTGAFACSGDMLLEALVACASPSAATTSRSSRSASTARRPSALRRSGSASTSPRKSRRRSSTSCSS